MQQREVRRAGYAREVGVTLSVESNSLGSLGKPEASAAAAQKGAEQQTVAVGGEPGYKSILPPLSAGCQALATGKSLE